MRRPSPSPAVEGQGDGSAGALKATGGVVELTAAGRSSAKDATDDDGSRWQGLQGEWWMQTNPSHPVVRGVDFALDTQEGGADKVYFAPDSDDEGYCNRWKLEGGEDEFVPESEPLEAQAAGVQGNISPATPGVDGDRQDCNQRRTLGLLFKGWNRALFPNDNLVAGQTVAAAKMDHESKSETEKECAKKVIECGSASAASET
ncbi:hypothetical protein U9M48_021412 [Paspalum notatum var. saurae]|uniref:Uncharacterized protein n=1 Tax=Paspalum notatum var. saurae TaxID=547442 RepID=A0AAQ3WTQ9_PASNO